MIRAMMSDFRSLVDFTGKTVVVAGGLGTIGVPVSRAFAEFGADVVIADVDVSRFERLVSDGTFNADSYRFVQFDITSAETIEQGIQKILGLSKQIEAWVNLAYPRTPDWSRPIEEVSFASWDENLRIHLGGYFWSSKCILEHMKRQGKGSLINFGSIYGVVGPQFDLYTGTTMTMPPAYAAIKGALVNLTRYFATLYGPHRVRVNCICPGGVKTDQPQEFIARYSIKTPLARMAEARELAMPTVFLASDAASYITGHILMVDGGWTSW